MSGNTGLAVDMMCLPGETGQRGCRRGHTEGTQWVGNYCIWVGGELLDHHEREHRPSGRHVVCLPGETGQGGCRRGHTEGTR